MPLKFSSLSLSITVNKVDYSAVIKLARPILRVILSRLSFRRLYVLIGAPHIQGSAGPALLLANHLLLHTFDDALMVSNLDNVYPVTLDIADLF